MRRNEEQRPHRGREYDLGAEGPRIYHGRRNPEEDSGGAESGGSRGRDRSPFGGIFKGNPMLLIVLVDILLIFLVAGILYPILSPGSGTADIAGYSFSLNGYREGGWAYVNVTVERTGESSEAAAAEGKGKKDGRDPAEEGGEELPQIAIAFSIPETGTRSRHVIVPPRRGDPRIVRGRLAAEGAGRVRAEIRFAGEKAVLEKDLEREE